MQGAYGGLIIIIMYAVNERPSDDSFALMTQNNLLILTQTFQEIQVQE
jgi:hypothetical protein